jgi:ribosomal RNA assembly protein
MEEIIKIPESRIGALIGSKGETKKKLMEKTGAAIDIDSHTGEVVCSGEGENFFKALDVVKAIGRGFSPARAFTILGDDYLLKIIEIEEYAGKTPSKQKALRGRVIGRQGLARTQLEKETKSLISVQGKTVAIIAKTNDLEGAVEAVESLLKGLSHEKTKELAQSGKRERFDLNG